MNTSQTAPGRLDYDLEEETVIEYFPNESRETSPDQLILDENNEEYEGEVLLQVN